MKFIKEQFQAANKYIKENILKIFLVFLIIFIAFGVVFYFIGSMIPQHYIDKALNEITQLINLEEFVTAEGGLSAVKLFLNNTRASALIYLYGFIPFLFLPAISMIFNSSLVGFTLGIIEVMSGENVFLLLLKHILPHGIFEIPALLLSGAAGVRLCLTICKKIFRRAKDEKVSAHFKGFVRVFLFYTIPLLIAAAFIEGVILPAVLM